jgi:Uma2 family endonuclease
MGLPVKKIKISVNEYLEFENSATQKHELIEGEMYAMTGTTRMHNRFVGNIFAYLHPLMKGKLCRFIY